ncbi:HD-GYP domain-containing protein [Marinobacter zhejiangensis]|uniref:HD domain-containing protein n=1 Tax=Marinobacter zhejiangensis TaxID=488535 RepID=A0A1I4M2S0_9GAMM|nr:HD domain-containing phosphohydrolase [Marinobacter zhejiangensis]SFL97386.1 HD domain-containing protein [Marinobacter zhejiangensis]
MSTSNLVRVAPGALVIGKPLPWTVYDADGKVLLRQGYVIQNETQLEQLFERGLFEPRKRDQAEPAEEAFDDARERNPFTDYPTLLRTLETTLAAISSQEDSALQRLLGLSRLLDRVCREAPDPCLALVHLYSVEPTAYEQTLFYAIICHFVAMEAGLDDNRTSVLVAAALTANIALLPFLDKLNASPRLLTDEQRTVIHKHPERSAQALKKAGIDNPLLIDIVLQHHEHSDGSGYPRGLSRSDILPEAQILSYAERYIAMITWRAYRERCSISDAQKAILEQSREDFRPYIGRALLEALTPYPPGSLVRLANNEVAVVTRRPVRLTGPFAQAILGPAGDRYPGSFQRDCSELDFNIRALEMPDVMPSMDFGLLWGFR